MIVRLAIALLALTALAPASPAGAQVFDGRPDAVVCPIAAISGRPGGMLVFHLVWRDDNGTTHYAAMGQQAYRVEIGKDGVVRAPKLKDCDGKTVEELRAAKRAFFYN
ncbi:MAG: hypothetical protein QNJ67_12950 [Kiloniellales bacterium]|nr:hypothetical protein [Kiloniellales bacterium]